MARLGRPYAELYGVFDGERLIGLYSPFDILFSLHPYEAWNCRGYQPADAEAVASNILLHLTALGAAAPTPVAPPAAQP